MKKKTIILISIISVAIFCVVLMMAASFEQVDNKLIFTQVSVKDGDAGFKYQDNWRYAVKARIVALNVEDPENGVNILTDDFYSARSPEISYDGSKLLFTGKISENDPWQIWEMTLYNGDARIITSRDEDCIDPAYLPDGKIIYSVLETSSDGAYQTSTLYACHSDGCCESKLTYHPHNDFSPMIQKDGRVIMISQQRFPEIGDQMMIAMRPDGTKAEMYYKGIENTSIISRGWETPSERFVFVESLNDGTNRHALVSISKNRPLHSRIDHSSGIKGNFHSVYAMESGRLITSYQMTSGEPISLYEFDPEANKIDNLIYSDKDFQCIEPVMVAERTLPRKLPSRVKKNVNKGHFVCLDTDFSADLVNNITGKQTNTQIVEVLGLDGKIIDVQVEADGSFYIEISPDMPVRFQTKNADGEILRGPSAWTWVRPNERRGCIGCHEDKEYAPENIVPIAIDKDPVSLLLESEEVKTNSGM